MAKEEGVIAEEYSVVGKSMPRVDAKVKALGKAEFTGDLRKNFPGLLCVKVLRCPHAHAHIVKLDVSRAESLPGVRAVVVADDCPWIYTRVEVFAFPAQGEVIWAGQGVAAVAAESEEIAEQALELIDVQYEVLPYVIDVEEAMQKEPISIVDAKLGRYKGYRQFTPEAPNIAYHHKVRAGDAERAFAEADVIVENRYYAARISHSQVEPATCIVRYETDGGITMWTNCCGVHTGVKALMCFIFKLPESKVRIKQPYQGGSFGNRLFGYIEPLAVLMALKTKGTVEVCFSRHEMYVSGPSNWPVTTYIKTGAKRDGTIVAHQIKMIEDCGATLNSYRDGRATASGLLCVYNVPNVHLDAYAVNTNTPPVGSYRGLGCPQVEFGMETQIDILADKLGMSALEIRQKNLLRKGDKNGYGEVVTSIGAGKAIEAVAEAIHYGEPSTQDPGPWRKGKGIAIGGKQNTPLGRSEVEVRVHSDGGIEVCVSCDEQGMGAETVMTQIAAEEFGASPELIKITRSDTALTPYDNFSASSRTTYNTGNALLIACRDAIRQLCDAAGREFGVAAQNVSIKGGKAVIRGSHVTEVPVSSLFKPFSIFTQQQWGLFKGTPVIGRGVYSPAAAVPWKEEDGLTPRMWNWFQYSACGVEVAVNVETGQVKVLNAVLAADMGFPINPKMCEGQIEGGFCMASSYSRNEEYIYNNGGAMTNGSFMDYRISTVLDTPLRSNFKVLLTPDKLPDGPYGAKGMAESNTVPVAPAIAAAIHNAVGVRPTMMPMSAERILQLLKEKEMEDKNA